MHKTLLYSFIDAPDIPAWFELPDVSSWLELSEEDLRNITLKNNWRMPTLPFQNDTSQQQLTYSNGSTAKTTYLFTKMLDDAHVSWAKNNISQSVKDIRFCFNLPGRSSQGPHTDLTRSYTLINVVKQGNSDQDTVFYKMKDSPIFYGLGHTISDYSMLEEIERVRIPPRTWVLLNAGVIHSVENIAQGRFTVQVSFDQLPKNIKLVKPKYA